MEIVKLNESQIISDELLANALLLEKKKEVGSIPKKFTMSEPTVFMKY